MKKIILALAFLLTWPALLGQERALVVNQGRILEVDPPQNLDELAQLTDVVAHVKITNRTASLDSRGLMVWRYEAEVLEVAEAPDSFPFEKTEIEFSEQGGAFYNGVVVRVDDNDVSGNLTPSEEYVVFLTTQYDSSFSLYWGKYAAFRVVADFVLPCAPTGHSYYELYGGLRLSDFLESSNQRVRLAKASRTPSGAVKR